MYRSGGFGAGHQLERTAGAEHVVDAAKALADDRQRSRGRTGEPPAEHVADLRHAVENEAESFLGGGREIRLGDTRILVRAEVDWSKAARSEAEASVRAAKTEHSNSSATTSADSRDPKLSLLGFVPMAPPAFFIYGFNASTAPKVGHTDSQQVERSTGLEVTLPKTGSGDGYQGMRAVRAPLRFTVSRVDGAGNETLPTYRVGTRDKPVEVDLAVPVGLGGAGRRVPVPSVLPPSGVLNAEVHTGATGRYKGASQQRDGAHSRTLFQQVAKYVGPLSPDGLSTLRKFVGSQEIKENLPTMAVTPEQANAGAGWVSSDALLPKRNLVQRLLGGKGQQLQARAIVRKVYFDQEIPGTGFERKTGTTTTATSSNTTSQNVDGTVTGAAALDSGMATGGGGASASGGRGASHQQDHSRSGGAEATRSHTGTATRFRYVYDLEFRKPGHSPITFAAALESDNVATAAAARHAGIDAAVANGAPARPEVADAAVRAAAEFDQAGRRLARIALDSAAKVFGDKRFVIEFDDPKLAKGISAKRERQLDRGAEIRRTMAPDELAHRLPDLLDGEVLTLHFHEPGKLHDRGVTLQLTAELKGVLEDRGPSDGTAAAEKVSETESGTYTRGSSWKVGGGLIARGYTSLAGSTGILTGNLLKTSYSRSQETGVEHRTERSATDVRGGELDASGQVRTEPLRLYRGKVEFSVSGTRWSRHNDLARGVLPGRPGKHAPQVEPLEIIDAAAVPDRPGEQGPRATGDGTGVEGRAPSDPGEQDPRATADRTTTERQSTPGRFETTVVLELPASHGVPNPDVRPVGHRDLPDVSINGSPELSRGASRSLDHLPIQEVHGLKHVRAALRSVLWQASGKDPIWAGADGADPALAERPHPLVDDNSRLIDQAFSAEALRGDPRAFNRKIKLGGLRWKRRRATEEATVAVSYRLRDPEVVGEGWQRPERSVQGGSTTRSERDGTLTVTPLAVEPAYMPTSTTSTHSPGAVTHAMGLIMHETGLGTSGFGRTDAHRTTVSHELTTKSEPRRVYLVEATVEATVAAESISRGNLDRWKVFADKPVGRAAKRFDLPRATKVWVTEEQLREIRSQQAAEDARRTAEANPPGPAQPPAEPVPSNPGDLTPVPAGTDIGKPRWADGVIDPVDLTDRIGPLHEHLVRRLGREKADRLLPSSSLETGHDNHREVERYLSQFQASLGELRNGGTAVPLRLQDRFSGETYDLRVDAELLGDPVPEGIQDGEQTRASKSSTTPSSVRKFSRVLAESFLILVPAAMIQSDSAVAKAEAGPGEHGAPATTIGPGLAAASEWFKQTRKTTTGRTVEHTRTETVRGPLAQHRAEVLFDLRIERHGERIAAAPGTRTVRTHTPIEDAVIPDPSPASRSGRITARAAHAADAPRVENWRRTRAEELPGPARFRAMDFEGDVADLVRGAEQAIRSAGGELDAHTRRLLREELTPARVAAVLNANDPRGAVLELPPNLGVKLGVHTTLSGPGELVGASDRIELDGTKTTSGSGRTEFESENSNQVAALPLVSGGVTQHPDAASYPNREDFGSAGNWTFGSAPLGAHATRHEQGVEDRTGGAELAAGGKTGGNRVTSSWRYGAGFRFVAEPASSFTTKKTAVVDVDFEQGHLVRRADRADRLPPSLVSAAQELSARSAGWTQARRELRAAEARVGTDPGAHPAGAGSAYREASRTEAGAEAAWARALQIYRQELAQARQDPMLSGTEPDARLVVTRNELTPEQRAEISRTATRMLAEHRAGTPHVVRYRVRGDLDSSRATTDFAALAREIDKKVRVAQRPLHPDDQLRSGDLGFGTPPHYVPATGPTVVEMWIEPARRGAGTSVQPGGPPHRTAPPTAPRTSPEGRIPVRDLAQPSRGDTGPDDGWRHEDGIELTDLEPRTRAEDETEAGAPDPHLRGGGRWHAGSALGTAVGRGENPAELPQVRQYAIALNQHLGYGRLDDAMRMLHALGREPRSVWPVQEAYRSFTGHDLVDHFGAFGPHAQHVAAQHLLAATHTHVSLAQAQQLHDGLRNSTFDHRDSGRFRVRTSNIAEGCYYRAHLWALDLLRHGVQPGKAFAGRAIPMLNLPSRYGGRPETASYHVAPTVVVAEPGRAPEPYVLDAAMSDRPLRFPEWLSRMGLDPAATPVHSGTTEQVQRSITEDYARDPYHWDIMSDEGGDDLSLSDFDQFDAVDDTETSYALPLDRPVAALTPPNVLFFPDPLGNVPLPDTFQAADRHARDWDWDGEHATNTWPVEPVPVHTRGGDESVVLDATPDEGPLRIGHDADHVRGYVRNEQGRLEPIYLRTEDLNANSRPIVYDGRVVGTSYITSPAERAVTEGWAQRAHTHLWRSRPGIGTEGGTPERIPAMWAHEYTEGNRLGPNIVDVHATADHFELVDVTGRTVYLEGDAFAQVLRSNPHFARALVDNPNVSTLLLGCEIARGQAAPTFIREHRKTNPFPVHYGGDENYLVDEGPYAGDTATTGDRPWYAAEPDGTVTTHPAFPDAGRSGAAGGSARHSAGTTPGEPDPHLRAGGSAQRSSAPLPPRPGGTVPVDSDFVDPDLTLSALDENHQPTRVRLGDLEHRWMPGDGTGVGVAFTRSAVPFTLAGNYDVTLKTLPGEAPELAGGRRGRPGAEEPQPHGTFYTYEKSLGSYYEAPVRGGGHVFLGGAEYGEAIAHLRAFQALRQANPQLIVKSLAAGNEGLPLLAAGLGRSGFPGRVDGTLGVPDQLPDGRIGVADNVGWEENHPDGERWEYGRYSEPNIDNITFFEQHLPAAPRIPDADVLLTGRLADGQEFEFYPDEVVVTGYDSTSTGWSRPNSISFMDAVENRDDALGDFHTARRADFESAVLRLREGETAADFSAEDRSELLKHDPHHRVVRAPFAPTEVVLTDPVTQQPTSVLVGPNIISAHGVAGTGTAEITVVRDGWRFVVSVDGDTFARLYLQRSEFHRMYAANPTGRILYTICSAAEGTETGPAGGGDPSLLSGSVPPLREARVPNPVTAPRDIMTLNPGLPILYDVKNNAGYASSYQKDGQEHVEVHEHTRFSAAELAQFTESGPEQSGPAAAPTGAQPPPVTGPAGWPRGGPAADRQHGWPEVLSNDQLEDVRSAMRAMRQRTGDPEPVVSSAEAGRAYEQWRRVRAADPVWQGRSMPRNSRALADEVASVEAQLSNERAEVRPPDLPGGAGSSRPAARSAGESSSAVQAEAATTTEAAPAPIDRNFYAEETELKFVARSDELPPSDVERLDTQVDRFMEQITNGRTHPELPMHIELWARTELLIERRRATLVRAIEERIESVNAGRAERADAAGWSVHEGGPEGHRPPTLTLIAPNGAVGTITLSGRTATVTNAGPGRVQLFRPEPVGPAVSLQRYAPRLDLSFGRRTAFWPLESEGSLYDRTDAFLEQVQLLNKPQHMRVRVNAASRSPEFVAERHDEVRRHIGNVLEAKQHEGWRFDTVPGTGEYGALTTFELFSPTGIPSRITIADHSSLMMRGKNVHLRVEVFGLDTRSENAQPAEPVPEPTLDDIRYAGAVGLMYGKSNRTERMPPDEETRFRVRTDGFLEQVRQHRPDADPLSMKILATSRSAETTWRRHHRLELDVRGRLAEKAKGERGWSWEPRSPDDEDRSGFSVITVTAPNGATGTITLNTASTRSSVRIGRKFFGALMQGPAGNPARNSAEETGSGAAVAERPAALAVEETGGVERPDVSVPDAGVLDAGDFADPIHAQAFYDTDLDVGFGYPDPTPPQTWDPSRTAPQHEFQVADHELDDATLIERFDAAFSNLTDPPVDGGVLDEQSMNELLLDPALTAALDELLPAPEFGDATDFHVPATGGQDIGTDGANPDAMDWEITQQGWDAEPGPLDVDLSVLPPPLTFGEDESAGRSPAEPAWAEPVPEQGPAEVDFGDFIDEEMADAGELPLIDQRPAETPSQQWTDQQWTDQQWTDQAEQRQAELSRQDEQREQRRAEALQPPQDRAEARRTGVNEDFERREHLREQGRARALRGPLRPRADERGPEVVEQRPEQQLPDVGRRGPEVDEQRPALQLPDVERRRAELIRKLPEHQQRQIEQRQAELNRQAEQRQQRQAELDRQAEQRQQRQAERNRQAEQRQQLQAELNRLAAEQHQRQAEERQQRQTELTREAAEQQQRRAEAAQHLRHRADRRNREMFEQLPEHQRRQIEQRRAEMLQQLAEKRQREAADAATSGSSTVPGQDDAARIVGELAADARLQDERWRNRSSE